jgi:adenylosuccinate synthase
LDQGKNVLIEGAQGHSLSIYHGFYPYTTSRDVSVAQLLADCAVPFSAAWPVKVIGTARTFPIRVANRYDENGQMVGFSGPHYLDQKETTFQEIGQEVELTTVTKLPRRIFTFSMTQVANAVRQNGVEEIFLNFCNYFPCGSPKLDTLINGINANTTARVKWLGFGPTEDDIADLDEIE